MDKELEGVANYWANQVDYFANLVNFGFKIEDGVAWCKHCIFSHDGFFDCCVHIAEHELERIPREELFSS